MTHVPHGLAEEFPDHAATLSRLMHSDGAFSILAQRYNDVNHTIYRIEAGLEATADDVLEDFKKQRLKLMDDIATHIARAEKT